MTVKDFIISSITKFKPIETKEIYFLYDECLQKTSSLMTKESFKKRCRSEMKKFKNKQHTKEKKPTYGVIRTHKKDGNIEVSALAPENFKSIEDVAILCNIDTNVYYPYEITSNRWNTSSSFVCWQFKVKWKPIYKNYDLKPKDAIKIFENSVKNYKPSQFTFLKNTNSNRVIELQIPDLHFGQLSWGVETGRPDLGNYDIKIAKQEFLKAIKFYVNEYKDKSIKKIIFPLGNDLFNVNNSSNTTSNGTLQDEDDRPKKTFELVLETIQEAIEMLTNITEKIDLIQIPGNHDEERIFYLFSALKVRYRQEINITVDTSPADRKYIKIGKTLLGLAHGKVKGKVIPMANYPSIMADEAQDLWSQCEFREMHIAHIHHNKIINNTLADEFRGTIVRVVPSLSQIDYWHYSSGYRGTRQAHVYEYDLKTGLRNICIYNA